MARGSVQLGLVYPGCVSGGHGARSASKWEILIRNNSRYVGVIYPSELQWISNMQIVL
jgi:hypothetical protein